MQPFTSQQSADLLEVIEDRSQRRSTIVTSQMPVKQWHEALGEDQGTVEPAGCVEVDVLDPSLVAEASRLEVAVQTAVLALLHLDIDPAGRGGAPDG